MKKQLFIIFCTFASLTTTGCDVAADVLGLRYDDTYDEYPEDDPSSYFGPDYSPSHPPHCAVSVACNNITYNPRMESADITVTIQNTGPDETAYDVFCVVTTKEGSPAFAQDSIDFENIRAGDSKTISTTIDIDNPRGLCHEFECVVTWSDAEGSNYRTQADVRLNF